ncbi:MAG: methyltransferase type 11, partial [Microbacteriaceae bacterium]|nr:methyltransferase type 11 [Microbacteriaceae bacterium]
MADFDDLIAEGESVPTEGWDFSWFDGRAIEERTSWGYSRLLPQRYASAIAVLDLETGGGEVFSEALAATPVAPAIVAATESWEPNLELARAALAPWRADVHNIADAADLPFPDATFDVVSSRHPTFTRFDEIARVLRPG